jgi:RecA-family ATPase
MSDAKYIDQLAAQWRATLQPAPPAARAATNGRATGVEAVVVFASGVRAAQVEWLIAERVPLGGITGLGGEPGLGKSALTALYAAEGSLGAHGDPWTTLFVSAEDSASRVIKPRLLALGADCDRVAFFTVRDEHGTQVPTLPDHIPQLRDALERTGARLLVLDPLNAFLGGDVDSHKDQSIRRVLAPLATLAEELHVAVIVVLHTRKQPGGPAVYRLGGSVGYGGAARSVLGFGRDPEDPDGERGHQRVLGHVRCNWGALAGTLVYRHEAATVLDGDVMIDTHQLVYVGESDADPSAVFDVPKDDRGADVEEAIAEAIAGGPVKSRDVKTAVMEELGVSSRTVIRAAKRLERAGALVISEAENEQGKPTMWAAAFRDTGFGATTSGPGVSPNPSPNPEPVAEPNSDTDSAHSGLVTPGRANRVTKPQAARTSSSRPTGATSGVTRSSRTATHESWVRHRRSLRPPRRRRHPGRADRRTRPGGAVTRRARRQARGDRTVSCRR